MKLRSIVIALVIGTMFFAACKQTSKPGKAPLKNQRDSIAYALGINIGANLKKSGFDSLEYEMFIKGMKDAVVKDTTFKPSLTVNEGGLYLNKFAQKIQMKKMEKNLTEGRAFLEKNKTAPGVKVTPSGLQYIVVKEGNGPMPKLTDQVKAHYEGTTIDGTVFDSSIKRGEPAVFGVDQVIAGWTEILQMMKVGSEYKVFIPSELGYGKSQQGDKIQPNSVLIFTIKLLSIEPKDASKDKDKGGKGGKRTK